MAASPPAEQHRRRPQISGRRTPRPAVMLLLMGGCIMRSRSTAMCRCAGRGSQRPRGVRTSPGYTSNFSDSELANSGSLFNSTSPKESQQTQCVPSEVYKLDIEQLHSRRASRRWRGSAGSADLSTAAWAATRTCRCRCTAQSPSPTGGQRRLRPHRPGGSHAGGSLCRRALSVRSLCA